MRSREKMEEGGRKMEGQHQIVGETARDGFTVRRGKCQRWRGGGVAVTEGVQGERRRAGLGLCVRAEEGGVWEENDYRGRKGRKPIRAAGGRRG